MSQRVENVKLAILEEMVKGYYDCSFAVGVVEKSIGPFLIASAFGAIKRIRHLIPFNVLINVYDSLIQQHFDCCNVV